MWPAKLNFQSLSGRRYSPTKSKKQEVADQELLLFQYIGAVALPLPPLWDAPSYL